MPRIFLPKPPGRVVREHVKPALLERRPFRVDIRSLREPTIILGFLESEDFDRFRQDKVDFLGDSLHRAFSA